MAEPNFLTQWVIYDHPSDYPNHFIAREWRIYAGRVEASPTTVYRDEYLDNVRTFVQTVLGGGVKIQRSVDDDPCIVEVWM